VLLFSAAAPPFYKNAFLVGCETTQEAILIDPGDEVGDLIRKAAEQKLAVRHILLTHAHLDHITGVAAARAAFPAPVHLHPDDLALYEAVVEQGRLFGLSIKAQPPPDRFYEPGEIVSFGRYQARVHHTPGHSPGGVCLEVGEQHAPGLDLFVGDTLFAGSVGRVDLPGGDYEVLIRSIREMLFAFPDAARVYPGHGAPTTIGRERRTNPFLV
jgi:hydroxyacylglutathione hydrolase